MIKLQICVYIYSFSSTFNSIQHQSVYHKLSILQLTEFNASVSWDMSAPFWAPSWWLPVVCVAHALSACSFLFPVSLWSVLQRNTWNSTRTTHGCCWATSFLQVRDFTHDDVIKWKHFPRYWPFVRGIHRSPVNSPHKSQWRGALMLSLICVWINGWVHNREAGDLRRYRAHYDVTVMPWTIMMACVPEAGITDRDRDK